MILQKIEAISSTEYCIWQSFSKCACTFGNCYCMFFSFGCWLNFSPAPGTNQKNCWKLKKKKREREDGITFCFEWFSSFKNMPTKCAESHRQWDRERETHCLKPDRMEKEKERRGGEGMNWDGAVPNFHPHPLPLNTEKFTFFPTKSA